MSNQNITFLQPPADFAPKVEVASCYCEFEDKILLLRRHPAKSNGGTWGVPAGKLEVDEDAITAIQRELYEEIGVLVSLKDLHEIGRLYVRIPALDFVYHMFRTQFSVKPVINLELKEHTEAQWATYEEALQYNLMPGEHETLAFYKQFINAKTNSD